MKLVIIILIAGLMQVSAASFGQKVSLSEKNATLSNIFQKMRAQTGYDFLFDAEVMRNTKRVNVDFKNAPLAEALEKCLAGQDLEFTIGNQSVIVRKKEKSYLETVIARFQAIDVRGKVVDSLGNGLAGATVSVKGAKQSTSINGNGDFYLKNVDENAILIVNYLGFIPQERAVGKDFIYIQLQLSSSKLDEVQVMAYGLTSKRKATGTITTIKAEEIEKQPVNNPLLALQGKVANLQITPASGAPGAAVKIQLRGQNSLSLNNNGISSSSRSEPLIVIDGVPFANNISGHLNASGEANFGANTDQSALSLINPNDIESINVLADADATSIYGSRGGNGVILITTKKGKAGKTDVSILASSGHSEVAKRLPMMDTQQYLEMRKEAFRNDGLLIPTNPAAFSTNNFDLTVWDQNRYVDWQDFFLGGIAKYNNVQTTISGGNQAIQYLISGAFRDKGGSVFPGNPKSQSGSLHFSLNGNSPDGKFSSALSGSYSSNFDSSPGQSFGRYAFGLAPNAPSLYNADGSLNWEPNPFNGQATWKNPMAQLSIINENNTKAVTTNVDLGYRLLPNLELLLTGGFSEVNASGLTLTPKAAQDPATVADDGGQSIRSSSISRSFSVDPRVKFNFNISQGKLAALFGGSFQTQDGISHTEFTLGYSDDSMLRNAAASTSAMFYDASNLYRYIGVFGSLNYDWADKYIINLTARRDGSSRFGPENKFGNFWSASTSWIFSNEHFLKDNKNLSFGKLRFTYGTSGNDQIGDYQYIELYKLLDDVTYQGQKTVLSRGATNPYFGWESLKKMELSLDLGFLNDRFLLMANYFRTRSSNQLGKFPLPATAGNSDIITNRDARIQNSGLEFSLTSRNINSKRFSWTTRGTVGFTNNKLLSLPDNFGYSSPYVYDDNFNLNPQNAIGKPFDGVVGVTEFRGVNPINGLNMFTDINGNASTFSDAFFNSKKMRTAPLYSGGITNSFSYRRFSLDIFVQFVKQLGKYYVFDDLFYYGSRGFFNASNGYGNQPVAVLDRWRNSGDVAEFRKYTTASVPTNVRSITQSDAYWVDASFVRINNISLSYSFPISLINKAKMQQARIFLNGQNLWTFSPYEGLDPQIQMIGVLPQLRTVTAGLSVNF